MATTYKSEIDTWMLVVVVASMAVCAVAAAAVLLSDAYMPWWTYGLLIGAGIALPLWLFMSTIYTLDTNLLIVRSGFLSWRIPIREISSITPTHSVWSSPALSLDRLRIDHGKNRTLMISPRNREKFLQDVEMLRRGAA